MSAQKELVSKSVKEVEEVVELFYQQKLQEALAKFEPVLGEMMTAIDTIFTYRAEHEGFELDDAKLTNTLKEAMAALQMVIWYFLQIFYNMIILNICRRFWITWSKGSILPGKGLKEWAV